MVAHQFPRSRFENKLRLEADRLLEDLLFLRSPVQSRLINYLVDRSLNHLPPPSQYEIAVDGLGKDADYDLSSDSYPRVQISRLRKNLDNYYARNMPLEDLRIALKPATYELTLIAPALPHKGAAFKADAANIVSGSKYPVSRILATISAAILVGLATWFAADRTFASSSAIAAGESERPLVALTIFPENDIDGAPRLQAIAASARVTAEMQLINSFVSRFARTPELEGAAEYSLAIKVGQGAEGQDVAFLSFFGEDDDLIYSSTIPFDETNPAAFTAELEAKMVYMTSPNGIIADTEIASITDPTSSDYACFLSIENKRSNGELAAQLVDECITLFPDSDLRAFWYARRAFTGYQSRVISGQPLTRDGDAWDDLQVALSADPYNAFANFVAAKIELANERCDSAVAFVEQTLDRGGSYPTLIAAIETDAAECARTSGGSVLDIDRVRVLALYNPSPDPLLHLYLMISALTINDLELADQVSRRTVLENPNGSVEMTSDLLNKSLADPEFAAANRSKLRKNLGLFVWNDASVERTLDRLTDR